MEWRKEGGEESLHIVVVLSLPPASVQPQSSDGGLTWTGNHAQALALAASTFQIPAYIVMPTISTPSKIAATQALTPHVTFSGTTSQEREEKVEEVIALTGAVLVPPYEHGDIVLGQGTVGLEIEEQFAARREGQVCTVHGIAPGEEQNPGDDVNGAVNGIARRSFKRPTKQLDAIIAPCGGGGLLSGLATYFSDNQDEDLIGPAPNSAPPQRPSHPPPSAPSISLGQHDELTANPDAPLAPHTSKTQPQPRPRSTPFIFGAEPSFQSADDALRSLQLGHRITTVRSLTIADGLRTPLGHITWDVIRKKENVEGIHSVSEDEIKHAMRLLIERAKLVVEPSGNVGLAVVLFDEGFRGWVEGRQREEAGQAREAKGKGGAAEGVRVGEEEIRPWDIGIVLSGGNTTVEAIAGLFGATSQQDATEERKHSDKTREVVERQEAKVTMDGERVAEDIAG